DAQTETDCATPKFSTLPRASLTYEEEQSARVSLPCTGRKFEFQSHVGRVKILKPSDRGDRYAIFYSVRSNCTAVIGVAINIRVESGPSDFQNKQNAHFFSMTGLFSTCPEITYEKKLVEFDLLKNFTFDMRIKVIRSSAAIMVFPVVFKRVIIRVEGTELEVDTSLLSYWSEFFSAYFQSEMRETLEGRYPIEECSLVNFREMLAVIQPCGKQITKKNFEPMLELGRRYMMPMLTHKCEEYLADQSGHAFSAIKLFEIAEKYELVLTRKLTLESLSSSKEFRQVMRCKEYGGLSEQLKRTMLDKYVEVDMRNNPND
ncbi:hypothetical protein PFISCL1PPCAC_26016, partial [Pristionchus fissidentatus]